jgi:hypothetical protein
MSRQFDLQPGERIRRQELHLLYGGTPQGGMSPSRKTPNVFLFADPDVGPQHGYIDGWNDDGCFHYTGMGQSGDQTLSRGNAALLRHHREGRAVRLFLGSRGVVTYLGRFEVDRSQPHYSRQARETHDAKLRKVIVFRLRRVDG